MSRRIYTLGVLNLVNQDRLNEAIASFRQALVLRPTSAEIAADLRLALTLQEKNRGGMAVPLQGALDAQADSAEGYFNRANGALGQGRLDDAEEYYRRKRQRQAGFCRWLHSNLGYALLANDNTSWTKLRWPAAREPFS